jgi:hypothetical protein
MNQESFTQRGILPICMHCKKIRDDNQQWRFLEAYIGSHLEAQFTHDICPDCAKENYGRVFQNLN